MSFERVPESQGRDLNEGVSVNEQTQSFKPQRNPSKDKWASVSYLTQTKQTQIKTKHPVYSKANFILCSLCSTYKISVPVASVSEMSFERIPESQGLDLNEDVRENGQAKSCSLNVIQDFLKNKIGETIKINS